jgi:hypothetical protein
MGQALFDFLGQRFLSFQSTRETRKNTYFSAFPSIYKAFGTKNALRMLLHKASFSIDVFLSGVALKQQCKRFKAS